MNKTNVTVNSTKGTSKLVRARFGPGMLLQHEDLEQLNSYTRELSRLMFGSLFGCGVICGLVVETGPMCGKIEVTVGAGLALNCSGDPVYVPNGGSVVIDEHCDQDITSPLWVVLCATVKCCSPRTSICSSDDDEVSSTCTRERDGFEIRVVRERPKCVCGCAEPATPNEERVGETECKCVKPYVKGLECYNNHYDGKCGCNCDECSDCDCECILLARLDLKKKEGSADTWVVDHRVRRFIRPVLMRDPQVEIENLRKVPPVPPVPPAVPPVPQAAKQETTSKAKRQTKASSKQPTSGQS